MSILLFTLKRILRNKVQLFFILLFPFAFMSFGFIGEQPSIKVAVIDKDQTPFTERLKDGLEQRAKIRHVEEEHMEEKLLSLRIDYIIVIDNGFTDKVIRGEGGGITSYSVKESNFSVPVRIFLEQWIGHAKAIAKAVDNEPESFYKEFEEYDETGALKIQEELVADPGISRTRTVMGYLIISVLYTSIIVGLYIILNKNNHTLIRTLAAPISLKSYMFQTVSSFILISIIQMTLVLLVLKWVYKLYLGDSALSIYLMLTLFSLVSVSFGVAISSFSKNITQACLIGVGVMAPMAMLGGAYFPLDYAPESLQTVSQFTPVSWVLTGIEKLLQGESITSLGKEMGILLLFAVIFFLLGTFRKVDIAK
ncbi:hypothetical protein GCM10008967_27560 [Bacillus carboniphilus]|uniref:ABC transmembrane type-2 domain-containing protein n=1 Tax=Bacillus carboniphilus TaxID=86663 RepID=A0ABP3G440_9BACI